MARNNQYRSKVFFRHIGAQKITAYLRIQPTALRFTQANKGSVADTLGGFFREVLYSEDTERRGLMLPDLTIECETGMAWRAELEKIKQIWNLHGDRRDDGTPAKTEFFDFSGDQWGAIQGVKSYRPRAYEIEILNFGFDDTVQDPFRIRFNFRCKVLRDLYWPIERSKKGSLSKKDRLGQPGVKNKGLIDPGTATKIKNAVDSGLDGSVVGWRSPALTTANAPLDVGGQWGSMNQSLDLLPQRHTDLVGPILEQLAVQSGLANTDVIRKAIEAGRSVFGRGLNYPQGSQRGSRDLLTSVLGLLNGGLPDIPTLARGTILQGGSTWDGRDRPESEGWVDDDLFLLR